MSRAGALAAFCLLGWLSTSAAQGSDQALEATTTSGDKVRLHPNGRWEYVDQVKQTKAKEIADSYPENRPADSQGGWFGIGRTIRPGDKDYNRGTLNPKK